MIYLKKPKNNEKMQSISVSYVKYSVYVFNKVYKEEIFMSFK